ncbi:hypothetical protein FIBSPDRAFT_884876 [Athelia psychrophila]|uniref:Uncharacterized protein n=1 Tax=Athelia psychrophila TaxID=1759441 RepID=A0A166SHB4_9AGAM|nr:hypothetical protein FIBSPDRAFT_884876 [Fibularhizoctonia sp. CBS 109695]
MCSRLGITTIAPYPRTAASGAPTSAYNTGTALASATPHINCYPAYRRIGVLVSTVGETTAGGMPLQLLGIPGSGGGSWSGGSRTVMLWKLMLPGRQVRRQLVLMLLEWRARFLPWKRRRPPTSPFAGACRAGSRAGGDQGDGDLGVVGPGPDLVNGARRARADRLGHHEAVVRDADSATCKPS